MIQRQMVPTSAHRRYRRTSQTLPSSIRWCWSTTPARRRCRLEPQAVAPDLYAQPSSTYATFPMSSQVPSTPALL
ncbi:hypothetical protein KP509_22G079800 [Ceratopteris richardii]|uniref:Uncharacterized protein n=1 Tax=Ceratopteris richardii TaxID=49495 RepID=A0A8T2S7V2_CERRI|nr:hypothetical protein KP509_22G079800 [Ceratopteris richardii]